MSIPVPQNIFTNFLALTSVISQNDMQEQRIENDVSGKLLYLGRTVIPNAATDEPLWAIIKFHYDLNGFLSRIQLPDDGVGLVFIWDDRATLFS